MGTAHVSSSFSAFQFAVISDCNVSVIVLEVSTQF
jgi:hypothetical protein